MRLLDFDGSEDSKGVFKILHTALMTGGELKSREQVRMQRKVEDKFDTISDDGGESVVRPLKTEGGRIALEDAEFEYLKQSMGTTSWLRHASRKVDDAFEFLESCPTEKAEAPPKTRRAGK